MPENSAIKLPVNVEAREEDVCVALAAVGPLSLLFYKFAAGVRRLLSPRRMRIGDRPPQGSLQAELGFVVAGHGAKVLTPRLIEGLQ
jgi:hypothetical protein